MNAQQTALVIDDESAPVTMFRLFLSACGDPVLTAETGECGDPEATDFTNKPIGRNALDAALKRAEGPAARRSSTRWASPAVCRCWTSRARPKIPTRARRSDEGRLFVHAIKKTCCFESESV